MFTLIESLVFTKLWPDYWSEEERGEFSAWLAENPEAGVVVPGSGVCEKFAGHVLEPGNVVEYAWCTTAKQVKA